ncbi:MAG: hypothetical protein R3A10_01825 [Caldilineaceae bacterium]
MLLKNDGDRLPLSKTLNSIASSAQRRQHAHPGRLLLPRPH